MLLYFALFLFAECLLLVNTQVYLQVSNTTSNPAAKGIYVCSHSSSTKIINLSTITRCFSLGNPSYVLYYKFVVVNNNKQQKRWYIALANAQSNEYNNIYGTIEISSDPWELMSWKLLSKNASLPSIIENVVVSLYQVDCKLEHTVSQLSEILYSKLLSMEDRHAIDDSLQVCGDILFHKIIQNNKAIVNLNMATLVYCNWLLYRNSWDESYQCYTSITTNISATFPTSYLPMSYLECDFDNINCLYFASLVSYTKHSLIHGEFVVTRNLSNLLISLLNATDDMGEHMQQMIGINKLVGIVVGDVIHNYYHRNDKSVDIGCSYINTMNVRGDYVRREVLATICHQLLSLPSNINTTEESGYSIYHWDRSVSIAMSLLGVGAIDISAMHLFATIKYLGGESQENNHNVTGALATYIDNSDSMKAVLAHYTIYPVTLIKSPNIRAAIILNEALRYVLASSLLTSAADRGNDNKLAVVIGSLFQAIAPTILSFSTEGSQWIAEVFMLRTIAVQSMQLILLHIDNHDISNHDFILMDPLAYFGAPCRGLFLLAYQGLSVEKYLPPSQHGYQDAYTFYDQYLPSLYYQLLLKIDPHWFDDVYRLPPTAVTGSKKHIKIGFLSSYFFRHPVGRLLTQVMQGLKSGTFLFDSKEVVFDVYVCINPVNYHGGKHMSNAGEPDDIYTTLCDSFIGIDRYIELSTDPVAAADRVRQLGLDVLVFGDIFMDSITAHIAMMRMARYQVAFWGHPYSSGYPTIDYFISNAAYESSFQRSKVSRKHGRMLDFSEQIIVFDSLSYVMYPKLSSNIRDNYRNKEEYINWLYRIGYDINNHVYNTSVGYKHLVAADINSLHVYGCYQTLMKMHPLLDDLLLGILRLDENGIILLARNPRQYTWYDSFISRLKSKVNGMNDSLILSRIIIVNQVQHSTYEDIICGVDVTLDPFPFGGGVTLADSLSCPLKPVPYVTSGYLQSVHNLGVGIGLQVNSKTTTVYCSIVDNKEIIHPSNTSNYDNYYINEYIKEAVQVASANQLRDVETDQIGIEEAIYTPNDTIYEWANFINRLT